MLAPGADLPSELLSHIIYHLRPTTSDSTRRARQGLAACSLVCRHWSNVISPMLFEFLTLRSAEDIRFLLNVIDKASVIRSFLLDSIQTVWLVENIEDVSRSRSWLHHAQSLSARLPEASFDYTVSRKHDDDGVPVDSSATQAPVYSPFRSLPRLPPLSSLRLTYLSLFRLRFASKTELAQFIDSFPSLNNCQCHQLTFVDYSPIVQSRRRRRRSSPSLRQCWIWRCDGTALTAQTMLASDILVVSAYLALNGDEWSTILHALLALALVSFYRVFITLGSSDGLSSSSH